MINQETMQILSRIRSLPDLSAKIFGQGIKGSAYFWGTKFGVVCLFDVFGLPKNKFLGLHIHEGNSCTPTTPPNAFENAGGHLNLTKNMHPNHSGDLPPLYSNSGHALSAVLIDKFTLNDIKNRTIIIHAQPDDFSTQPSGNSKERIACGVIK